MPLSDCLPALTRLARSWAAAALLLVLAACGGGGSSDEGTAAPPPATPARIEIAPDAVLLTAPGQRKPLTATVFDADGNPISAAVEWVSSRPSEVAVDAAGVLTANGAGGTSQVTARIGALSSRPLLVVHTAVPAGTVLLTDAQISGDPAETDPDAEPGVGNTYVVQLQNIEAPAVGALLMNTEGKPVAGRVQAVETVAGVHRVTLALVPAPEMFPNLSIDESIDLNTAEVEIPAALSTQYDITREGNTFTFTPKPGQFTIASAPADRKTIASAPGTRPLATATPIGTSALPPFTECKLFLVGPSGLQQVPTEGPGSVFAGLPVGLSVPPAYSVTVNNRLDVKYTSANGLERFVIHGEPTFTSTLGLKATVAFEGKVNCEVELLVIRIPVGGPVSLIIGGLLPVGVGAELGGKLTVASLGITLTNSLKTAYDVGIACPPGGDCSLVKEFAAPVPSLLTPRVDVPGLDDLRYEPSLSGYAFVKASIGNPFLKSLKFDALQAQLGLALRGSFAPQSTQIADPVYKSDYKLLAELRAGAGTQLSGLAAMLGLRGLTAVELVRNITLASSPVGSVTADRNTFARGETVNFNVKLDPTKVDFLPVLGPYNVKEIVLLRRVDITTQLEVARVAASPGQSEFTIPFTAQDAGRADEFFAFVVTSLLPFDLASLEVGRVQPGADPVVVNAASAPGGTVGLPYNFTLGATGGTGTYAWSVSAGELPGGLTLDASTGVISGTPSTAGTFEATLRATSGDLFGELPVSITIGSNVARLTVNGVSDIGNVLVTSTALNRGQVGTPYRGRVLARGASSGGWTGRVTSEPAGIDCTFSESSTLGDCFFDFPIGTRVKLLAFEEDRSTFVRWSRPCDGTLFVGGCTVTMTASGTVAAFFRNGNWEVIPVTWPLPAGLSLDPVTGVITGTPTESVFATVKFRSSGGGMSDDSNNILIEIRP